MAIILDKPIVSSEWLVEQSGGGVNGKKKDNNNKSSKISGKNNLRKENQNINS